MSFQEQVTYLERSLILLAQKIINMQLTEVYQHQTVNVTYFVRKGKITRYMFSMSVRCELMSTKNETFNNNKFVAQQKVKSMKILSYCSSFVLTLEELLICKHPLRNCAELASWEMLSGKERKLERKSVILYS